MRKHDESNKGEKKKTLIPNKGKSNHKQMPEISVCKSGVMKLLSSLNIHKATGPDEISARLLKESASQITPAFVFLFQAYLSQGKVPDEWKNANVVPIFNKIVQGQWPSFRETQ